MADCSWWCVRPALKKKREEEELCMAGQRLFVGIAAYASHVRDSVAPSNCERFMMIRAMQLRLADSMHWHQA